MQIPISILSIIGLLLISTSTLAQNTKEDTKVQIFTYEEKANLQNWFLEEVKRMEFTQETEAQYSSIITYYIAKIARLDDKDQDLTDDEFLKELKKLLKKQDKDLNEFLSPEQFAIHQEIYGEFLRSAYKRWGIEGK
ncbi:MAG: hypothetical protein ABF293_13120 [Flavobacteriaceae bacterium]